MVKLDMGLFEHRGVVIVIEEDKTDPQTSYLAKAGGRSLITMTWAGDNALKKVIDLAHKKINDAYAGQTEKLALWLNDTTHWMAENKDIEVPVMLNAKAISAVLEEVLKRAKGLPADLKTKAESIIERVKKEL